MASMEPPAAIQRHGQRRQESTGRIRSCLVWFGYESEWFRTQGWCACRYFSEVELRELFSLDVSRLTHSHTAEELQKHHSTHRAYSPEITAHVASLTDIEWAVDTSDHSVLFSRADESASGVPPLLLSKRNAAQHLLVPVSSLRASCR